MLKYQPSAGILSRQTTFQCWLPFFEHMQVLTQVFGSWEFVFIPQLPVISEDLGACGTAFQCCLTKSSTCELLLKIGNSCSLPIMEFKMYYIQIIYDDSK